MTTVAPKPVLDKGLGNTIASESAMSWIDGQNGVLEYVGIDIDSLARKSTFEESVFLLWRGKLPTAAELEDFCATIRGEYGLPDPMWDLIRGLPRDAGPMHAIRTLVSALALYDPEADDPSLEANERKGIRLLARSLKLPHQDFIEAKLSISKQDRSGL